MLTNNNIDAFTSIEITDFMGANVFKESNLKECFKKTTRFSDVATQKK